MEGQSSKLTRAHSSLVRSPTIAGLGSFESDPEEMKPHSPPQSASFAVKSSVTGIFSFCHRLAVLSVLLILLLLLSFVYLRDQSPSLWNLSLASAAVAAASLVLKRARFSFFRFRFGRSEPVRWFIGDDEGDVENPRCKSGDEKPVREGVEFYSNGDFYEGEFYRGKCGGSGVYNFFRQGKYEGDWVDGKYDGYGIERWARGSRYHGQYHRGLRHGFGVYKFYNGDSYAGEWAAGQSHGRGVQGCSDGSCFVGEFKCGAKHGLGYYRFRNGDRYAGEYFADRIHGFGVYYFANGQYYEGSWHEGRRQGFGTYTFRSGEAKSGEWDCGTLKNPLPLTDPSVERAMQSARKASEQALHLPSVEDQANKAVASAHKAAVCARVASVKAVQNRMDGMLCN